MGNDVLILLMNAVLILGYIFSFILVMRAQMKKIADELNGLEKEFNLLREGVLELVKYVEDLRVRIDHLQERINKLERVLSSHEIFKGVL